MFYRKIHTKNDTWKEAFELTYVYTLSYRIMIEISNIGDPGMPTIFGHFFFYKLTIISYCLFINLELCDEYDFNYDTYSIYVLLWIVI